MLNMAEDENNTKTIKKFDLSDCEYITDECI